MKSGKCLQKDSETDRSTAAAYSASGCSLMSDSLSEVGRSSWLKCLRLGVAEIETETGRLDTKRNPAQLLKAMSTNNLDSI